MSWTQEDFDAVAKTTNLSARTLSACRAVLVEGQPGSAVASEMGMQASQISRAMRLLREIHVQQRSEIQAKEFQSALDNFRGESDQSRSLAILRAREIAGPNLTVRDAEQGEAYTGKGLFKTPLHLVQAIGAGQAVIHELSKLERLPNMNSHLLQIKYPKEGKLASVAEKEPEQIRGGRGR